MKQGRDEGREGGEAGMKQGRERGRNETRKGGEGGRMKQAREGGRELETLYEPSTSASSFASVACLSLSWITAGSLGPFTSSFVSFLSFSSHAAWGGRRERCHSEVIVIVIAVDV